MRNIKWILIIALSLNLTCGIFFRYNLWYIQRGLFGCTQEALAVDVNSTGNIYWATEQKAVWLYRDYNIILYKIDSSARQDRQSASLGNGTGLNDITFMSKVSSGNLEIVKSICILRQPQFICHNVYG